MLAYSMFLLMLVAVERYFAVCKPFYKIMNKKRSINLTLLTGFLSICIGVPAGILAGDYVSVCVFESISYCYTGVCNEDGNDYRNISEMGSYVYYGFLCVAYLSLLVCVIVVYSLVFCTLYRRFYKPKKKARHNIKVVHKVVIKSQSKVHPEIQSSVNCSVSVIQQDIQSQASPPDEVKKGVMNLASDEIEKAKISENNETTEIYETNLDCPGEQTTSVNVEKANVREIRGLSHKRAAKMLLLVTVVFLVTWIPFFLMKLHVIPNVITIRLSFFLSNMLNPIIYSLFSKQFRENVRKLFNGEKLRV